MTVAKALLPLSTLFDVEQVRAAAGINVISVEEFMRREAIQSRQDMFLIDDQILYDFRYADQLPAGDARFLVDNHLSDLPPHQPQPPGANRLIRGDPKAKRYLEIRTELPLDRHAGKNKEAYIPLVVVPEQEHLHDPDLRIPAVTDVVVESQTELALHNVHDDPATNTRTVTDRIPLDKFQHIINLEAPLPRPNVPLVLIGTTFGSSRILLTKPANVALRRQIRSSLVYSNSVLDRVVESIASKIGQGAGSYVGVHLRVGDGFFQTRAQKTVQNMVDRLQGALEGRWMTTRKAQQAPPLERPLFVYLSTDAPDPTTNSLLDPLRAIADRI